MTDLAVALLSIADWEPADDLDVRILDDDSVLLFLDVPFAGDGSALDDSVHFAALAEALGPQLLAKHRDPRGVFLLADAMEPEDASSYEAVLQAVGDEGHFLPFLPLDGRAAALLRVPGWKAPAKASFRTLADGAVVVSLSTAFTAGPLATFDDEPHYLALMQLVGELTLAQHDDERGVFLFPEQANVGTASSYDEVLEAISHLGVFLSLDGEEMDEDAEDTADGERGPALGIGNNVGNPMHQLLAERLSGAGMDDLLNTAAQAMGFASLEEMQNVLTSQDPELLQMAEIKMSNSLERSMEKLREASEAEQRSKTNGRPQ